MESLRLQDIQFLCLPTVIDVSAYSAYLGLILTLPHRANLPLNGKYSRVRHLILASIQNSYRPPAPQHIDFRGELMSSSLEREEEAAPDERAML